MGYGNFGSDCYFYDGTFQNTVYTVGCVEEIIMIEYYNGGMEPFSFEDTIYPREDYYTVIATGRTSCDDQTTFPDACHFQVVTPSQTLFCASCTATGSGITLNDCDALGIFKVGSQGPAPSFYDGDQGLYPGFWLRDPGDENGVEYCFHPFWSGTIEPTPPP